MATPGSGSPALHRDKVAVVTGGAAGLGRAFARRLARDGAKVVIADIDDGADTAGAIIDDGGEASVIRCDVSSESSVASLREQTLARYSRCDILVNNAGLAPHLAWDELDFSTWRKVMAVNLDGMFLTCKAFVPTMRQHRFGRIVNISTNLVG